MAITSNAKATTLEPHNDKYAAVMEDGTNILRVRSYDGGGAQVNHNEGWDNITLQY